MNAEAITSRHNPRIKRAAHLRERRQRERQRRFLIDGGRELLRALAARMPVDEFFFCHELCRGDLLREIDAQLPVEVPRFQVTPEVYERLAYGERNDGLVAVAHTPERSLADLALPAAPLVAVLEDVEKPGNLGAVLRSADAARVSAVIVAGHGTDLYNPNVVRASMGTLFTVPACAAPTDDVLAWLRAQGLKLFAARVDATVSYTDVDWCVPAAIILGSEAEGLSTAWHSDDITAICLPMHGIADSLNVSVTASVIFYEALRQRQLAERGSAP